MRKNLFRAMVFVLLTPGAIAAESSGREFSKAMALAPDTQRGQELFRNCVSCHGPDGSGDVAGSVPRIAGQYRGVLVRQLLDFRRGKRWDYGMEAVTAVTRVNTSSGNGGISKGNGEGAGVSFVIGPILHRTASDRRDGSLY